MFIDGEQGKAMLRDGYVRIPHGLMLERIVLRNSKKLFGAGKVRERWKEAFRKIKEARRKEIARKKAREARWWWEPSDDSLIASFCRDSSIHGLPLIVQPKRHLTERIFWIIAFLVATGAAAFFIQDVWTRYLNNPVVVTFQSTELGIEFIPFPAVTICNMNKFPRSKYEKILNTSKTSTSPKKVADAKQKLGYINTVCSAEKSFSQILSYSADRGEVEGVSSQDEGNDDDIVEFLIANTSPCEEMLRLCIWGEDPIPCDKLFKALVTDYGKCCTFNHMPIDVLYTKSDKLEPPNRKIYQRKPRWTPEEKAQWMNWRDLAAAEGLMPLPPITDERPFPYRQRRAGMPFGLRILLDGNTDEYFCSMSDSEGFRFVLHTSIEIPHVMDFGSIIELGKEINVEISPDVTLAEDAIKAFDISKRQCYLENEKPLQFFSMYTANNCQDECAQKLLLDNCNCTMFYLPRLKGIAICNTDIDSPKGQFDVPCAKNASEQTAKICSHCEPLCGNVQFHFESTSSELQNGDILWKNVAPGKEPPAWSDNKLSMVHLYFGEDGTVPRLRKRIYGTTDMIASTGGLLGLCLGFSIISALEFLYFLTLRAYWGKIRRIVVGTKIANGFTNMFKTKNPPGSESKPNGNKPVQNKKDTTETKKSLNIAPPWEEIFHPYDYGSYGGYPIKTVYSNYPYGSHVQPMPYPDL